MSATDEFIPMLSSDIAHGIVIYHNGATDYFDALDRIEARLNNTPIDERRKQAPQLLKTVNAHSKKQRYSEILSEHGERIKRLWEEGKTFNDLQMIMSMSPVTIQKVLKDMGVDTKEKRKKQWNESFKQKKVKA